MSGDYPAWAPNDLVEWLNKLATKQSEQWSLRDIANKLARDERMQEVWAWHGRHCRNNHPSFRWRTSVSFCISIQTALRMPGKPGNMPSKKREAYFEQVRKHASALSKLLDATRYDTAWDDGTELPEDEFEKHVVDNISSALAWTRSEGGDLLLAYSITESGIISMPWDYPCGYLNELLQDVMNWTYREDYWGRGFVSSKPIRQSVENADVNFFNCTLYESLKAHDGVAIPFSILATLANIALELPSDKQVHEDTAQKQVRRYLARRDSTEKRLPEDHLPF